MHLLRVYFFAGFKAHFLLDLRLSILTGFKKKFNFHQNVSILLTHYLLVPGRLSLNEMWTRVSDLIINKSLTILHKSICTRKRSWMRSADDMIYACLNILNKIWYTLRYAKYIQNKVECNTLAPFLVCVLSRSTPYTVCMDSWMSVSFNFIGWRGRMEEGKKNVHQKLPIEHTTESAIKCTYYTRLEHAYTAVCTLQPNH